MSGWGRANSTQQALAKAEAEFEKICNTDGEVSEEEVEIAYSRLAQAAAEADEAFNEIWIITGRQSSPEC